LFAISLVFRGINCHGREKKLSNNNEEDRVSVFDKFHEIVEFPHRFATEWKEKNRRKVLAYVCTNIPEELAYAAGVLPVRLLGSNESENVTGPFIFRGGFCAFCRDCFAQILLGRYDYIDGIVYGLCCSHARQIFQGWQSQKPSSYSYELYLPISFQDRNAVELIVAELEDFRRSLEGWLGNTITTEDLDRAIDVYNTNRRLMGKLYELMKSDDPPITAVEIAEIGLAGLFIDKQTHNGLLEDAMEELRKRKSPGNHGIRIMLLGSVNNDMELMRLIENAGGLVVTDDYCTGKRYYDSEVSPQENRLAALAERLVNKTPCPLKDLPERKRVPHISQQADEFRIRGVIYTIQRLCDSHGLDSPAIESLFKEKGIPILKLEVDPGSSTGQLRTRIEAFVEMIDAQ
jgi:benzoyl-CoA reductase subunit C